MGYVLRDGLHCCIANGRVVFLDLTLGSYSCLSAHADGAYQYLVAGASMNEVNKKALEPLIEKGLIAENIGPDRLNTADIARASHSLFRTASLKAHPFRVFQVVVSLIITDFALKSRPFGHSIEKIRQVSVEIDDCHSSTPPARYIGLTAAYLASKLFLPSKDTCLRDSVSYFNMAVRAGLRPKFVIGVRMEPFGAHAWVQQDTTVLNDDLDRVLPFTPILVA